MKHKFTIFALIAISLLGLCIYVLSRQSSVSNNNSAETVAILQTVEHPALNSTRHGIEDYLKDCCKTTKTLYENAQGDYNLGIQIAKNLIQDNPKVVATIGTLASQIFLKMGNIPVVFSSVTDPKAAGLVKDIKNTGTHFSGVSNMVDILPQLQFFQSLYPSLKKIGIIYNSGEVNSIVLINLVKEAARKLEIEIHEVSARSAGEVIMATSQLTKNVDAIFITNDNTALSALSGIIKVANSANIPVFCSDGDTIGTGVLATLGPDQYEIGMQTGKIIEQVLKGSKIEDIPVSFPNKMEKRLDISVANKLKIKIDESVLKEIDKVVEEKE